MFTGIVETLGEVADLKRERSNMQFWIRSEISSSLKIDQSVAHDGVCLTVTGCNANSHTVVAIDETLQKSNLGSWTVGRLINLERAMLYNGRLDGHLMQGHVDDIGTCSAIEDLDGSTLFTFTFDSVHAPLLVQKGSISINGVSLTVIDPERSSFKVAIIPYTLENTVFKNLKIGDKANLEFDILGKYVQKTLSLYRR